MGDLVCNPALRNIESERHGISRKLEDKDQNARAVIEDRLHLCAFRDCSLGFSCVGPFPVGELSEKHLQQYVDSNYTGSNTVFAAVGQTKHEDVVDLVAEKLNLPASMPKTYGEKPYFCGADLVYRNDEMGPTAYVSMGFEGVPHRSSDAVTFMLLASMQLVTRWQWNIVLGSFSLVLISCL